MGSHRDQDSPIIPKELREMFQKDLEERAERMTALRENVITAPRSDEEIKWEHRADGLLIRCLADDPARVVRISIGTPEWDEQQAYFVFRGDLAVVHRLLARVLHELQQIGHTQE